MSVFDPLKTNNIQDSMLHPFEFEKAYIKCSHCGEAAEVDTSVVLTSYPPKYSYHCPRCNKHGYIYCRELESERLKVETIKPQPIETVLCTSCLVCEAPITTRTLKYEAVICEDCKKAILKLRKMLEDNK